MVCALFSAEEDGDGASVLERREEVGQAVCVVAFVVDARFSSMKMTTMVVVASGKMAFEQHVVAAALCVKNSAENE